MLSNKTKFRCSALKTLLTALAGGICLALGASPAAGQSRCDLNGVAGVPLLAQGTDSLVCGDAIGSVGPSSDITIVGLDVGFTGDSVTLIGAHTLVSTGVIGDVAIPYAPPVTAGSTAVGAYAAVAGTGNVAVGDQALVGQFDFSFGVISVDNHVQNGTAVGSSSTVTANNGTALGADASVFGEGGTALGSNTFAVSDGSTAVGSSASAGGVGSLAVGSEASAGGIGAIAIGGDGDGDGFGAFAFGNGAIAMGDRTQALGEGAIAIGDGANANSVDGIAIGAGATTAGFANSVAIGSGTINTAADQVHVGGRTISGVAAGDVSATSTDAVNGSQLYATNQNVVANAAAIAALGTTVGTHTTQIADLQASSGDQAAAIDTLETTTATHTTQIATHTSQITAIEAVNATQSSQISALEAAQSSMAADIDTLFDLRSDDRRDMKQGVAAAMSMASAPMPSEPGRISYAVNGATFRGEYAVGGSLMYRLPTGAPMAVNVGFSYAGNKNNGVRVGVAGEF